MAYAISPRTPKRLAILGGGQLALMLAQAASQLGVSVRVLAASPEDPAARGPGQVAFGRLDDEQALVGILEESEVVTVENEFVDVKLLEKVLAGFPSVSFEPSLGAIWEAQDKLRQKRVFVKLGIDTAPFSVLEGDWDAETGPAEGEIERWLDEVARRFPSGAMLKWSRWGYDGKGNRPFRESSGLEAAVAFCREGIAKGAEIYAEEWIAWEKELAMVGTRARNGEYAIFPLVQSFQERGVCREVRGPAWRFGIPERAGLQAAETVRKIGDRLGMTGTFAVEFFWTADGRMLANEMAPRVHNTGHYSRHPGFVSQFENHVRAVTGMPLVPFGTEPGAEGGPCFGMRNLLAPEDAAGIRIDPEWAGKFLSRSGSDVEATWYGKRTAAPMRKMGHLTVTDASETGLERRMREMAELEDSFWREAKARANR